MESKYKEPIRLAIYTTDDERITEVLECDADGDPLDSEIDAGAIIAHVDKLVTRLKYTTNVLIENNTIAAGNSIKLKEVQVENEQLKKQIDSLHVRNSNLSEIDLYDKLDESNGCGIGRGVLRGNEDGSVRACYEGRVELCYHIAYVNGVAREVVAAKRGWVYLYEKETYQ